MNDDEIEQHLRNRPLAAPSPELDRRMDLAFTAPRRASRRWWWLAAVPALAAAAAPLVILTRPANETAPTAAAAAPQAVAKAEPTPPPPATPIAPAVSTPNVAAPSQIQPPPETLLERAYALDSGEHQARDAKAAAALYQQAADAGDAFAHLRLGYLAEIGDGVPQDYGVARAHYEAAVAGGLNEARLRLAMCHLEGWGGPVDRAAFVREIRAAAEAGYPPAQRMLATMSFIGFAVPEDRAEGVKWLERAATLDDTAAQYRLGRQSERLSRLALNSDAALARTWYQLSAEQEYRTSMRAMARTFLAGTRNNRNWELGHRWLLLATEHDDAEAPYILAITEVLHPDAPQRDLDQAHRWLELASQRGNPRATEVLQLEIAGRPLADAMRYVLTTPFDERYVQRAAAKAGDGPTRPPVIYRIVRPIYPQSLRLSETTGDVMVEFVVDTTGRVTDPKVIKSAHPLFAERAVEAVKQWRFYPGRKDDRLVRTRMRVPVHFTLEAEDMSGVDGLLRAARTRAERLGAEVEADAKDLRLAKPKTPLPKPTPPPNAKPGRPMRAMLLLVLDPSGRPLRGHILDAEPKELGPTFLTLALAHEFEPRIENGEAIDSNVVLPFSSRGRVEPVAP